MKKFNQLIIAIAINLLCGYLAFAETALSPQKHSQSTFSTIQRVRVDFVTPIGYTRHLLLGFTSNNAASDGVDYGYDAVNMENLPDDLNWRIEDNNYIIQGVGAFNTTKVYPFRMFLSNSGEVEIALNSLENFSTNINVYVYDAELGTATPINNSSFVTNMASGEYINRFFIAFTDNTAQLQIAVNNYMQQLSVTEYNVAEPSIYYTNTTHTLNIISKTQDIDHVELYDISGRLLLNKAITHSNKRHIELQNHILNTSPYVIVKIRAQSHSYSKKLLIKP